MFVVNIVQVYKTKPFSAISSLSCSELENIIFLKKGDNMFIVIEGDNGVGKTTVSHILSEKHGFEFITEHKEILELEEQSKHFDIGSPSRFNAFLEYNRICGKHTEKYKRALLARYWISTVSAAYADKLFEIEQALEMADKLFDTLVRPDFVFRLKCKFDTRINRIEKRAFADETDDITAERNRQYSFFLDCLKERTGIITEIVTDEISPEIVAKTILDYIGEEI